MIFIMHQGPCQGREERQPPGSNLCAFSSALFLDMAIKLIFDLLEEGERDGDGGGDELELALELTSRLQGLSVEASKYAAKRRGAKRDFMHLLTRSIRRPAAEHVVGRHGAAAAGAIESSALFIRGKRVKIDLCNTESCTDAGVLMPIKHRTEKEDLSRCLPIHLMSGVRSTSSRRAEKNE